MSPSLIRRGTAGRQAGESVWRLLYAKESGKAERIAELEATVTPLHPASIAEYRFPGRHLLGRAAQHECSEDRRRRSAEPTFTHRPPSR